MSDTRELRDKLEETQAELRRTRDHLEKLRAHQARERQVLQQQLEQARREVSGLRGHLEALELFGRMPPPPPDEEQPEPAPAERSASVLVALARSPATGLTPSAISTLAQLLNVSPVDVRLRLAPALPAVLARRPLAQAEELRASLRDAGFFAVLHEVSPATPRQWVGVKRFALEEEGLRVESPNREILQVRYAELRLLMRGRRTSTQIETKQEVDYEDRFDHYHRTVKEVEEKRETVENFLWVMGKGFRAIFNGSTQFMGLGALRTFTVHDNLQRLMAELHRRAPHAARDERFVQQSRFVMPLVDPGRSQETLAELLFQSVEEGLWS
jgi:hypothetical protein